MSLEFPVEEAKARADKYMGLDYHWGPSILQVMWEANGKGDDSMLWAGTNFFGGISRHREGVCGAVSAMAVYLGFRFRPSSDDEAEIKKAKETARAEAGRLTQEFKDKYTSIICNELLDIPSTGEENVKRYMDSEERKEQCNGYVRFVVEQIFGLGQ